MTIDEFMQTKLFGALFSFFCICSLIYFVYQTGMARGYRDGWAAGRAENPKPEVLVVSEYIFDDKRIARFDPRSPDHFLIMDFEAQTIARVPTHEPLEKKSYCRKQIIAKRPPCGAVAGAWRLRPDEQPQEFYDRLLQRD